MRSRFPSGHDRYDRRDDRERGRKRSRSIERRRPSSNKYNDDTSKKKLRYRSPSRSSSHSSYCSTCSYSSASPSSSRSLISCSTCSGYYSRGSSSSSSRNPTPPVKSRKIAGRFVALDEYRKVCGGSSEFQLIKDSRPIDPRIGKTFPSLTTYLAPVHFQIDKNWVYTRIPSQILLMEVSASITSKAQLLGFLEAQGIPKNIQDIDLRSKLALVQFADGPSAYAASHVMKAKGWSWEFDEGGKRLEKFLEKKVETTVTPIKKSVDPRKPLAEVRQSLSCHSKIPCILVDYEFYSYREASADLAGLFSKYRLHSVQRGKESWHIHLYNEEDVEDAYLNRYSFEYNDRRIRPYLSSTLNTKKQPERVPRSNLPTDTNMLDDLRSKILESTLNNTNSADKELKVFEPFVPINQDLLNLPMFNKKYLEKLQAMPEEEDNESDEEFEEEESLSESAESESVISGKTEKNEMALEIVSCEELPQASHDDAEQMEEVPSGSVRLEGYYKQTHKKVWFEPLQAPASSGTQTKGRTGRATSRRFDNQMAELMGKLSSLQIRQKALILNRSSIHSYGLFAGEEIEPGELVIEYIGEIIRHSLANIRERRYEQALKAAGSDDIASSYFFRLDLTYVVDASNRGNLARFVNHSCDPNCTAKVVQIEGAQHIVFYARRPIGFGEEITYDYKFAIEEDPAKKIRCLCGTSACRKYLN